ncbi:TPA: efflux RND transporter periplasmic adaptor subunit [Citrobacter koseri]|uniref:efflux RND transporter periplasmic adaptor subunit n=1 Tax=Citrobacter koseri TaxID=545 RepID=UPI001A1E7F42|nr:efflux RND transporter periplasmic adaptor subunit [Citrobacter koseri]HDQ2604856.1 efflux RND transporter periplasmic adaptor subunit [Citrobacter koseri]
MCSWLRHAVWPVLPVFFTFFLSGCDKPPQHSAVVVNEVGVVTLRATDVPLTMELPGRTTPYLVAEIRPQVGGILQKRLFEEGSMVSTNQVLYQIDPASYQADLAKAEATLESARLLARRYDTLVRTNAISQQDRDDARSAWLQAKATMDLAKINLGYTKITAPISGRIGRSSVTQGALLTANQSDALATIQQLDPIYVDIPQSSTSLLRLQDDLASGRIKQQDNQQAEVRLFLDNGTEYPLSGKLKFSEVTVDEGTNAVIIRAVFPNPDNRLLPGMFVRARLQEGVREHALLVPQRGITRDANGQATALVVNKDNKVELRNVITERVVANQWLVSDGLLAGDKVIVDGVQKAQPGSEVKIVAADTGVTVSTQPL